jgi:hypothetical protein
MRRVLSILVVAAAACVAEGAEPSPQAAVVAAPANEVEEKVLDLGDAPLEGAEPSLDALGRFDALVQHPNAYKMGPELLWDMHAAESNGDLSRVLSRYGGKNLAFESIAIEREEKRKGGLLFHKRPTIVAKDADGNEVELRIVGTIIEHPASGSFKILGFKNDD